MHEGLLDNLAPWREDCIDGGPKNCRIPVIAAALCREQLPDAVRRETHSVDAPTLGRQKHFHARHRQCTPVQEQGRESDAWALPLGELCVLSCRHPVTRMRPGVTCGHISNLQSRARDPMQNPPPVCSRSHVDIASGAFGACGLTTAICALFNEWFLVIMGLITSPCIRSVRYT